MMIYSNFSRMFEGKKSTKINESILLFGDLGEKEKKISGRVLIRLQENMKRNTARWSRQRK